MPEENKFLSKVNLSGETYLLKDKAAQDAIAAEIARADAAEKVNAAAIAAEAAKAREEEGKLATAIANEKTRAEGVEGGLDTRLTAAEAEIDTKQDIIDVDNKLAAAFVSLTKPEGSKLTSADVQAAVYELEAAIETGGTGSVVNVVKKEQAESGMFASYEITQGGTKVGATINIPKDYLVKSAELKTVEEEDVPYQGAHVGDKYIDFVINSKEGTGTEDHIYLPVNDLVDAYFADNETIQMVNNTFSVKAVPIAKVTGLQDALDAKALATDLTTEINRAKGAEQEIAGDLAAEVTRATDKEAELNTAIGDEVTRATGVEGSLNTRLTTAEGEIDALQATVGTLGDMAFVDQGTADVAAKEITGIKATGSLTGSAAITLTDADATAVISSKADYTPSGTISAADGGSFSALKTATFGADNNGVEIGGTNAASAVTVDSSNATVLGSVKTAAVAPSFVDNKIGTFVAPQLTIAESDSFAKAGFTAEVGTGDDAETLILTVADTGKASVCSGWNAGSWTQGTFNAGSAAEFNNATVIGSISGGTAAAQVFTGNKYSVATTADTALKNVVFTGDKSEQLIPTGITYKKADAAQSGDVTITSASLDVGTINVPGQTITVNPKND